MTSRAGKYFILEDLKVATNNFDDALVIGYRGFAKLVKKTLVVDC